MQKSKTSRWKELLLSPTLVGKNKSHKIAYVSVMTALTVVANMLEIPVGVTQFSLTLAVTALAGILIGPLFGFAAGFLGDVVGFLYRPKGEYLFTISLSAGLFALIAGFIVNGINSENKPWLFYLKLTIMCVSTFLICTVAITNTTFWKRYSNVGYWTFFIARFFVQGQIWNSLFNYALLFIGVPVLARVKSLKIRLN